MANEITKTNNQVGNTEKNITDGVLTRVNQLTSKKELVLPQNYSPENALKFAFLDLKANNLLNTDKDALANALLNMVVQGLSPQKKQCYFINYGGKVNLMRSYHGDRAVARLSGLVKDIQAYIIREGDEVNITYDAETNYMQVEHKTDFKNWNNKIIGAYAVAIMPDGTKRYDLMTIERIRKSWAMSSNQNNNKLQNNFSDDACQRTITRHLVKNLFNQSTDESLLVNSICETSNNIKEVDEEEQKETKYDESQIIEAQVEETATITPEIEEEETPQQEQPKQQPQNAKPTQEDIFNQHLNDDNGLGF